MEAKNLMTKTFSYAKKGVRFALIDAWLPEEELLADLMDKNLRRRSFFIQIGSNDGKTGDPIHEFIRQKDMRGVLVEPAKEAFERLKQTYKGKEGLYFENSAITESRGARSFYRVEGIAVKKSPVWHTQWSTLKKDILLARKDTPGIEKHIVTETVNCLTFEDLIRKYSVEDIDLLHIDAEGYDFKIIQSIDFRKVKPRMILFEHQTIYVNWKSRYAAGFLEYVKCLKKLKKEGYTLFRQAGDTLAILNQ